MRQKIVEINLYMVYDIIFLILSPRTLLRVYIQSFKSYSLSKSAADCTSSLRHFRFLEIESRPMYWTRYNQQSASSFSYLS